MPFAFQIDVIWLGLFASLGAGLATGLGAIPTFFIRNAPPKLLDGLLGFSAGIMLAASLFSLILPSIKLGGPWVSSLGIILGGVFLAFANWLTPHIHSLSRREGISWKLSRTWLFILAITLHNFPEGMSVGVGFGKGNIREGIALAMVCNFPQCIATTNISGINCFILCSPILPFFSLKSS